MRSRARAGLCRRAARLAGGPFGGGGAVVREVVVVGVVGLGRRRDTRRELSGGRAPGRGAGVRGRGGVGGRHALDARVDAEDVDERLAHPVGVRTAAERLGEADGGDREEDAAPVVVGDLGVLRHEGPRGATHLEQLGEDVGPRPAQGVGVEAPGALGGRGLRSGDRRRARHRRRGVRCGLGSDVGGRPGCLAVGGLRRGGARLVRVLLRHSRVRRTLAGRFLGGRRRGRDRRGDRCRATGPARRRRRGAGGAAAGAANDGPAGPAPEGTPPTSRRRSSRSRRAAYPASPAAAGRRMRAAMSSSWRRGAVAPVISVRPALTTSAARDRAPAPKPAACALIRSSWSCGTWRSTAEAPSPVAWTTMRSRSRSRRSSTKRRGSSPVSTTLSTTRKTAPASPTAKASIVASRSSPSVKPSRAAADS